MRIRDFFARAGLDSEYENGVLDVSVSVQNHIAQASEGSVELELVDEDR